MSQLMDVVQNPQGEETAFPAELYDPNYQSNMYLIESALRKTGADNQQTFGAPSVYDDALMRLIDSVPLE